AWVVPLTVAGGKPVTVVPGLTPMSPVITVAPVLTTESCASTANVEVVPSTTTAGPAPPLSRTPSGLSLSQHPATTSASSGAAIHEIRLSMRIIEFPPHTARPGLRNEAPGWRSAVGPAHREGPAT